jgi:hypothetical protein
VISDVESMLYLPNFYCKYSIAPYSNHFTVLYIIRNEQTDWPEASVSKFKEKYVYYLKTRYIDGQDDFIIWFGKL